MKTDMKEMRERMDKKIRSTENMSPLAVEPPKKFAPYDKLNGNENLRESIQANWPSFCQNRHSMFTGEKLGDLSIRQFLGNLTDLQETYFLSQKEFLSQLSKAVGGQAYDFVQGYLAAGNCSVRQLYRNLLARFDNTIPPEKAKQKLEKLRARRSDNLVRLLGDILQLTQQASQAVPPKHRKTYRDDLGAQTIINALPVLSKNFAREKLVQLQEECKTQIPSFSDLAEVLSRHSQFINEDIAENATGYPAVGSLHATQQAEVNIQDYDRQPYERDRKTQNRRRSHNRRQFNPQEGFSGWQRQVMEDDPCEESQEGPWDREWE